MTAIAGSVEAAAALEVIRALDARGVASWVAGGWGVDALIGRQTREHRDLDLAISADQVEVAIDGLGALGYQLTVDERPARFELRAADGRSVDVHPVSFRPDGGGTQPGFEGVVYEYPPDAFTSGSIDGVEVRCLTARQQIAFHVGYEPTSVDREDMRRLATALGLRLPPPYG